MGVCSDSQVDQFNNFWVSESSFWLSGAFGQAIGTPLIGEILSRGKF